jgi:hypothetical protein
MSTSFLQSQLLHDRSSDKILFRREDQAKALSTRIAPHNLILHWVASLLFDEQKVERNITSTVFQKTMMTLDTSNASASPQEMTVLGFAAFGGKAVVSTEVALLFSHVQNAKFPLHSPDISNHQYYRHVEL